MTGDHGNIIPSMSSLTSLILIAVGLFVGMLICFEWGHRLGRTGVEEEEKARGVGAVEGAVFALFGLVLAFSFSAAWERYEQRRHTIIEETNALHAAYMRIDLLPKQSQPDVHGAFRNYLDARMNAYRVANSSGDLEAAEADSDVARQALWDTVIAQPRTLSSDLVLLPALNNAFEIGTMRTVKMYATTPWLITAFMGFLSLLSALLAGRALTGPKGGWFHRALFSLIIALTIYVVLDLDHPRAGLIRMPHVDREWEKLQTELSDREKPEKTGQNP